MCGIVGIHFRESVNLDILDTLFSSAEKRGQDEVGVVVCGKNKIVSHIKHLTNYSSVKKEILDDLGIVIELGDLVIANFRAIPETEGPSCSSEHAQPITNLRDNLVLTHNGAVSAEVDKKYRTKNSYKYGTQIDSETILAAYLDHGKNLKKALETDLIGGFAFLLYDQAQHRLKYAVSHLPLSVGYIRGLGMMWHSNMEAIGDVVFQLKGVNRPGFAAWEDYYYHPVRAYSIHSYDLDSGMINKALYTPRYFHPKWTPKHQQTNNGKDLYLVSSSGGIDSSMAGAILKKSGLEVKFIHFQYGHRGQKSEEWAAKSMAKQLRIDIQIVDLTSIFSNETNSMLTDPNAKILTGRADKVKTTNAWVSNRNGMFLSAMATIAEQSIFQSNWKNIYLTGGFVNLSESSVYPDNSERFLQSGLDHIKFSCLSGHRIKPSFVTSNLMKSELWILAKELDVDLANTISCDRPYWSEQEQRGYNCNNQCGSTLLSTWARTMSGLNDYINYGNNGGDPRQFHNYDDPEYKKHEPKHMESNYLKDVKVQDLINRLNLPENNKNKLLSQVVIKQLEKTPARRFA